MPLNREAKFPSRRAYVLKVRVDATPDALAGRIENMVTGQQREFASGDDLLQSLAADLEGSVASSATEGADIPHRPGSERERNTR